MTNANAAYGYSSGLIDPQPRRSDAICGHVPDQADEVVQKFVDTQDSDDDFQGTDFVNTRVRDAHTVFKKAITAASAKQYDTLIACLADRAV